MLVRSKASTSTLVGKLCLARSLRFGRARERELLGSSLPRDQPHDHVLRMVVQPFLLVVDREGLLPALVRSFPQTTCHDRTLPSLLKTVCSLGWRRRSI